MINQLYKMSNPKYLYEYDDLYFDIFWDMDYMQEIT